MIETEFLFPGGKAILTGRLIRDAAEWDARQVGVIVTGSWLTVKEQMPLLYARRLATRGYAAFIFDFAGFGESAGEPRQAEIPMRKIEDICAATEFLSTLSFIEPSRIGYVAICASAQYTQHAIARGARIDAFASVAGWFHDARTIAPFYGEAEGIGRRMAFANADLRAYLHGEARSLAPAYNPGDEHAGMHFELDYYANPARGAVPSWKNEPALAGNDLWLVGGCYEMSFAKNDGVWRIAALTLARAWTEGNADLPRIAGDRAGALRDPTAPAAETTSPNHDGPERLHRAPADHA